MNLNFAINQAGTLILSFISHYGPYPGATDISRRGYRKVLKRLLARMKQWTKVVPESALSKYWIMLVELARLNHKHSKATKLYDQVIQWAQEHCYPRYEAIANELAAQLYLSMDKNHIAEAYLHDACTAYFRWGALGKIKSLQERYLFSSSFHSCAYS